jgi:hypothetical protein
VLDNVFASHHAAARRKALSQNLANYVPRLNHEMNDLDVLQMILNHESLVTMKNKATSQTTLAEDPTESPMHVRTNLHMHLTAK